MQDLDSRNTYAVKIATQWQDSILQWYPKFGRVGLIWRNLAGDNAPYGVYISEIMLQQTQVKRVEIFYPHFMEAFPTLYALASAPLESILKAWEGLGYYKRARMLHQSAQICMDKHNGVLPSDYISLRALHGIGSYTAGAILCFGFHQAISFVDSNISRVLCRVFAITTPQTKELERLAEILLSHTSSFDYNQALLDIGALICTPKSPSCLICPLIMLCRGKDSPSFYPTPKKHTLESLHLHFALCVDNENIALTQSTQSLYYGLYNLPILPKEWIEKYELLGEFKHHYTKYNITAFVYRVERVDLERIWQENSDICMKQVKATNSPKNTIEQSNQAKDSTQKDSISNKSKYENLIFLPLQNLASKPLSALCKKALIVGRIEK